MDCDAVLQINRCLGGCLSIEEQALFSNIIRYNLESGKRYSKAEQKAGSAACHIPGAVKVQDYARRWYKSISGFYFPGDLVGVESTGEPLRSSDASH